MNYQGRTFSNPPLLLSARKCRGLQTYLAVGLKTGMYSYSRISKGDTMTQAQGGKMMGDMKKLYLGLVGCVVIGV